MSKELVISANRHETRVALIEDDQLVEVYFQRANEYSLAGSIHKGRVTRVLPGMQSAFVDVGLERDTFLYVTDFLEEHEDIRLVFTDINMPGSMDGLELARHVSDRWPDVKLIVTSGGARKPEMDMPAGGIFIAKPYSLSRIVAQLRSLLEAPAARAAVHSWPASGVWGM